MFNTYRKAGLLILSSSLVLIGLGCSEATKNSIDGLTPSEQAKLFETREPEEIKIEVVIKDNKKEEVQSKDALGQNLSQAPNAYGMGTTLPSECLNQAEARINCAVTGGSYGAGLPYPGYGAAGIGPYGPDAYPYGAAGYPYFGAGYPYGAFGIYDPFYVSDLVAFDDDDDRHRRRHRDRDEEEEEEEEE